MNYKRFGKQCVAVGATALDKDRRLGLKEDVQRFLKERGAFKTRVANPSVGFEKATKGCHPLEVLKNAK